MPIRITGMNSGLDTDSIIQALMSAYRVKGDKYKKEQTKISWKQDKWKALNTKVYNLYKSLDNLRFSTGYNLKKVTVSDSSKATVSGASNAVNGTRTMKINQLAQAAYLSGDKIYSGWYAIWGRYNPYFRKWKDKRYRGDRGYDCE